MGLDKCNNDFNNLTNRFNEKTQ